MAEKDRQVAGLLEVTRRFVAGDLAPAEFDDEFRRRFSELLLGVDDNAFLALERLAFVCEDYVDDPSIREADDVSPDQLLAAARETLRLLDP